MWCAAVCVRRTLAPAATPPPENKEQLFPKGGKAMVGGRSFTSRWVGVKLLQFKMAAVNAGGGAHKKQL